MYLCVHEEGGEDEEEGDEEGDPAGQGGARGDGEADPGGEDEGEAGQVVLEEEGRPAAGEADVEAGPGEAQAELGDQAVALPLGQLGHGHVEGLQPGRAHHGEGGRKLQLVEGVPGAADLVEKWFLLLGYYQDTTQPPTVVCKMEA